MDEHGQHHVVSGNLASAVPLRVILRPKRQSSLGLVPSSSSSSPLLRTGSGLPQPSPALSPLSLSVLMEAYDRFVESALGGGNGFSKEEKTKMLGAKMYRADDPLLTFERHRCRQLVQFLNLSPPPGLPDSSSDRGSGDLARVFRRKIFRELFRGSSEEAIKTLELEPPFSCEYGCNIEVHLLVDILLLLGLWAPKALPCWAALTP